MNLIEPILAHVMKELRSNPQTTLRELRMGVHRIWNEIPKDSLERLYDGMTRRVDVLREQEDIKPNIECSVNYLIHREI